MTMGYENITTDGKLSYTQLCDVGTLDSPHSAVLGKNDTGLRRVTVLFQNNLTSCISMLDQVTSFRFQSTGATPQVSFCLDNITLPPSTLQPAGKHTQQPHASVKFFPNAEAVAMPAWQLLFGTLVHVANLKLRDFWVMP